MPLDFERVHKPIKKLRKILKRTSSEPLPEDIHQLRTNIRRLEATIDAFSLDSRHGTKRLRKRLSRLRKLAGKIRDTDVFTGYAASINPEGEDGCKIQLLEYLGAKRQVLGKKLYGEMAKHGGSVRHSLKRLAGDVDQIVGANDNRNGGTASLQAAATALRLQSELATTPKHLGRQNLHPYRLKVKELRNVLQLGEHPADKEFLETLKRVKDAIGEWHDWDELVTTAERVLDHGARCNVVRALKRVAKGNYERALSDAENMRMKYLQPSGGRKGNEPVRSAPVLRTFVARAG
jgi:CHAD domain-containing protein